MFIRGVTYAKVHTPRVASELRAALLAENKSELREAIIAAYRAGHLTPRHDLKPSLSLATAYADEAATAKEPTE